MAKDKLLSAIEIAKELNFGDATTKFLLKRFKEFLPRTIVHGKPLYSSTLFQTLFAIHEKFKKGILPSQIEAELTRINTNELSYQPKVSLAENDKVEANELDDLSMLIDQNSEDSDNIKENNLNGQKKVTENIDDLSVLLEDISSTDGQVSETGRGDLALQVDSDIQTPSFSLAEMDELSNSIDPNADHLSDPESLMEKSKSLADEIGLRAGELPIKLQVELINTIRTWQYGKSREFKRKEISPQIDVLVGDRVLQTNMKDISASGVLIRTRENIEVDQNVKMVFSLPEVEKPFKLEGRVVRSTENEVAVKFKEVSPYFSCILNEAIWRQ